MHPEDARAMVCGIYPMMKCAANGCMAWQNVDSDGRGFCWQMVVIKSDRKFYPRGDI